MKRNVRKNVEQILAVDTHSRNNDKRLILMYWKIIDQVSSDNFEIDFMEKATMPESIRRARQLIQEEGKYLPTEETARKRRQKQAEMKDSIINRREVV